MGNGRYAVYDGRSKCQRCGAKRPATILQEGRYICYPCKCELDDFKEMDQKKKENDKLCHICS